MSKCSCRAMTSLGLQKWWDSSLYWSDRWLKAFLGEIKNLNKQSRGQPDLPVLALITGLDHRPFQPTCVCARAHIILCRKMLLHLC